MTSPCVHKGSCALRRAAERVISKVNQNGGHCRECVWLEIAFITAGLKRKSRWCAILPIFCFSGQFQQAWTQGNPDAA